MFSGELSDSDEITDCGDSSDSDTNQLPLDNPVMSGATSRIYKWEQSISNLKQIAFTGTEIPLNIKNENNPIEYFNLLATDQFYNLLVAKTNKYAEEIFSNGVEEQSRITYWTHLTVDEFKIFFGLLFHTGTIRLSRIEDYWKTHYLFNLPVFRRYMSRNRFQAVLRCLHFADNPPDGEPIPVDRLYKLRPLLDYFNDRMTEIYYPGKNLCIDESVVLCRGRLIFRQYIKNKRHKYGVKLYLLCEANGMVQKVVVCTGSNDTDIGGIDHASNVVHKLLENKLNKGHSVYMDNFYNSVPLAEDLLEKGTYITGTIRKTTKGLPRDLLDKKLEKGELIAKHSNNISIQKWKDKREVLIISTEHNGELIITGINKRGQEIVKPKSIFAFNKYMGGIDTIDQMLSYYPCERKTLRWNQKLGIHVFQLILLNSYFLYEKHAMDKLSLYDYRLKIIDYLLSHKCDIRDVAVPDTRDSHESVHSPQFMKMEGKKVSLRKRCKLCYANGRRKDTTYHCALCPEKPPLCLECFPLYHKDM